MAHVLLISLASGLLLHETQLTDRSVLYSHEKSQVASLLFTVFSLSDSTSEGKLEWVHTGHLGCRVSTAFAERGVVGFLYGESDEISPDVMGSVLDLVIDVSGSLALLL